ncbi:MAG TPA: PA2169 family four-helix-bundle protein [Pyrinomonadaceae bacterium]|jgi:uncharacterized protein (TIGR02284 family)
MANDSVVTTLNNLIETCKDGQEGFQQAAEGVQDSSLKSLFYEYSQQRAKFVGELQGLVRDLGGEAETSSSIAGALHRGWINIKSAVTGRDDAAILNECERGEDIAKSAYKDALAADLPSNVTSVIQEQATQVQQAHDRIRGLRDAANNEASSTATTGH